MVRRLEEAPVTMTVPLPGAYMSLRDEAIHGLDIGTTHTMRSMVSGIFLPSWQSREYTLGEKIDLWRGKIYSRSLLWDKMIATDLTQQVPALDLPVYFCHGIYDYTVSYTEAKAYFKKLKAPVKGFYTFEQSAHSPLVRGTRKTAGHPAGGRAGRNEQPGRRWVTDKGFSSQTLPGVAESSWHAQSGFLGNHQTPPPAIPMA